MGERVKSPTGEEAARMCLCVSVWVFAWWKLLGKVKIYCRTMRRKDDSFTIREIYLFLHSADPATNTYDGIVSLSLLVAFRASFLFILLSTEITQYKDELFLWSLYGNKCVTWMWCCCCVRCLLCTALSVHLCCSHFFFFFFFTFPSSSSSSVAEQQQ